MLTPWPTMNQRILIAFAEFEKAVAAALAAGVKINVEEANSRLIEPPPPLPVILKADPPKKSQQEERRTNRQEWRKRNRDYNHQLRTRGRR
jgi:hypothetical protein